MSDIGQGRGWWEHDETNPLYCCWQFASLIPEAAGYWSFCSITLEGFPLGEFVRPFFELTWIVTSANRHWKIVVQLNLVLFGKVLPFACFKLMTCQFHLKSLILVLEETVGFLCSYSRCPCYLWPYSSVSYCLRHHSLWKQFFTDLTILPRIFSSSLTYFWREGPDYAQ